jgi:sacsin
MYLPNISPSNPGKRINFVAAATAAAYPDQLEPYRAFGCNAVEYFAGTLFRFPFRAADLAAKSRISNQVGSSSKGSSSFRG